MSMSLERRREYNRQYYLEHHDQLKKQCSEYYYGHLEECKERNKKYRTAHLKQCKEREKRYRAEHPEKVKEWIQKALLSVRRRFRDNKRRAEERGIPCLWSEAEFIDWVNKQDNTCFYCGEKVVPSRGIMCLTLDRLDNTKGYELGNVVIACARCNTMKGSWLTSEQMLDAAKRYF